VNFEDKSLQVKRTIAGQFKGEYRVNEPKTASGRRSVLLPQFAIDALKLQHIDLRVAAYPKTTLRK